MKNAGITIPFEAATEIELERPVSIFRSFIPWAMRALGRNQGRLSGEVVHSVRVSMKGVTIDEKSHYLYRKVCGYDLESGVLPVTFPEALFVGLLARLMTCRDFPLSPLALIHIGQTIKQYRNIPVNLQLDLDCRTVSLIRTEKGILLDILLEVRSQGELLWEGTAAFISRKSGAGASRNKERAAVDYSLQNREEIVVPGNTGRRYARASGDWNPHHLFAFTARPLGYRRPIAHGMWSVARCMASMERNIPFSMPCSVEAEFKLPLLMPATVTLNYGYYEGTSLISYNLIDTKTGGPCVTGKVQLKSP